MGAQERSLMTKIKRRNDGTQEVVVPDGFVPWRIGQRVWFHVVEGRIEIAPTPQGRRGAGRNSRRIRRGMRSLLKEHARRTVAGALPHERP